MTEQEVKQRIRLLLTNNSTRLSYDVGFSIRGQYLKASRTTARYFTTTIHVNKVRDARHNEIFEVKVANMENPEEYKHFAIFVEVQPNGTELLKYLKDV